MDAGKKTINDIFNGYRVLEIPFFQRAYVWKEENWKRLLDDLEAVKNSERPHFLGSVILKQQLTQTAGTVGDWRTLIDGQQRLTTLCILFKVYYLKIQREDLFDRIFRVHDSKPAIMHSHNDLAVFNRILDLTTLDDIVGNDLISQAYAYFKKNLDVEKFDGNKILAKIVFVGIDLHIDEDEQQIFDTINSLGVRLTTGELLKNHLFGRDDLEIYESHWKSVFENDEETLEYWDRELSGRFQRSNIDQFFHSFLQIKIQDPTRNVSTADKQIFTKVDGLFESYKKFLTDYGVDKRQFINEIREYALLYRSNFDHRITNAEIPAHSSIQRINAIIFGLEITTLIPYILFVLRQVPDIEKRNELFEYIEAYILRRLVCRWSTQNYNYLFSERFILGAVLSKMALADQIKSQKDITNQMPTDDDLLDGFLSSKLINKQSKGVFVVTPKNPTV